MGFGLVLVLSIAWIIFLKLARRFWVNDADDPRPFMIVITGIALSICTAFGGVHVAKHLLDIWNWVGVFEPKLYIAKMALTALAK